MRLFVIILTVAHLLIGEISLAGDMVDTTFFSVKDFGVKGDGKQDYTNAFLKCFVTATQKKGIVVVDIPYGIYNISRTLKINVNACDQLIIRGHPERKNLPVIKSGNFITLIEIYNNYWSPKGKISISNISLIGNNQPFSSSHPFYDKSLFCSGINILNLKEVKIFGNEIRNIYGNGISVGYSNIDMKNLNNRFDYVIIANNQILNCWGLHPTRIGKKSFDDYGDGIYTNSIKRGNIHDNRIINDLGQTKQLGRAGITLEFNDEDCQVTNNYVFGYDRDIHIEADIGGHLIKNDTLKGSDFGILIYDVPVVKNKPIQIVSNYISNKGLPLKNNYTRVRNSEERCLLSFYAKGDIKRGSQISSNHFEVSSSYDYKFSSIVRFSAPGLIVKNNTFFSDMPDNKRKTVNFYLAVDTLKGNKFENVNVLFSKKDVKQIISGNKTVNKVNTNMQLN